MNRIENNSVVIGNKYISTGLFVTENKPAMMGFRGKLFDMKRLTVAQAKELHEKGFRCIKVYEAPKPEKAEAEQKTEAPEEPKKSKSKS